MQCNSLSASRKKCYHDCEFSYYLKYHLGIKQEKSFPAEQGTFAHEIYERLALEKIKGEKNPNILKTWFQEIINAYRNERKVKNRFGQEEVIPPLWKLSQKALSREKNCNSCPFFVDGSCWVTNEKVEDFQGCPKDEFQDTLRLVEQVLYHPGRLNPLNKKLIAAEQSFRIYLEDGQGEKIPINGIIDLVSELDHETIEIEDYKTGKGTQNWMQCQDDDQFKIYFMAAKHLYPQYKHVLVTAHYLKRKYGPSPTVIFSDEEVENIKKDLIKIYHEIKNNDFPVRRCDRHNGRVYFDWKCEYWCNPDICQPEYEKFIKNGGISE